jgi:hypothetical protein
VGAYHLGPICLVKDVLQSITDVLPFIKDILPLTKYIVEHG